jgi:hypothetical protein
MDFDFSGIAGQIGDFLDQLQGQPRYSPGYYEYVKGEPQRFSPESRAAGGGVPIPTTPCRRARMSSSQTPTVAAGRRDRALPGAAHVSSEGRSGRHAGGAACWLGGPTTAEGSAPKPTGGPNSPSKPRGPEASTQHEAGYAQQVVGGFEPDGRLKFPIRRRQPRCARCAAPARRPG